MRICESDCTMHGVRVLFIYQLEGEGWIIYYYYTLRKLIQEMSSEFVCGEDPQTLK